MAEFGEVDANEVQKEMSLVGGEGTQDGNEETVVKIKLLEESVSLQVNDAEQVEAENVDENKESERQDKETARKEKRRQRREKRRERERSKGSTSDENDLKQESSSQEKKAKIESEEETGLAPKEGPAEKESIGGRAADPSKDGVAEEGEPEKGEPMEVHQETNVTVNLAGGSDGNDEAEIHIVQSDRKESAAMEVRALLEANIDGEARELVEKNPETEQRAKEERERRAEEVLAAMNFENEQEGAEPDLQADDAPARGIVEEFFVAQETKKDVVHLLLMLSSSDSDQRDTHHEEETTRASEEDKDAKLEELFYCENGTDNRNEEDNATQDGNPVEEMMVAQLQRETHVHPQVWQLSDDDHEPELNGGKAEPVALSEEEKEAKLKELFQEEMPKGDDPKESSEPQTPAKEAEFIADCQFKVEAGVDLSVLDANKSAEPTQDEPNDDSLEGKEGSLPDVASEEETDETEPSSEVHESIEEYVYVPDRKVDLCLEALSSGDDESPAEEAERSTKKGPPKDLDSLFSYHTEPGTKKEEDGREQEAVADGEDVKEEEIREERKAADVECAWDMTFFEDPEKNEKPGDDKAGQEIGELEAETKTTETISSETQVEKFTESKTTYTTSIVIKPVSPTLKKSHTFETADTSGEAVTRSTVTTTLETIMVTKVTAPDSPTGEPQVVLRRNIKKEIEDAFEPLPDKESEGTAPLAQTEGTGLESSEEDLLKDTEEGDKSGNDKEPLIEKSPKEEEPGEEDKNVRGKEPEVETKEPEAHDEEDLIPEGKKKKGKITPKCCVLQ